MASRKRLTVNLRPLAFTAVFALLAVLALLDRGQPDLASDDFQKYNGRQFTVLRVIDGDTITLNIPDGDKASTTVRLWGVDTPETKAPGKPVAYFGPEATDFTTDMVAGRLVTLELEPKNTRGKFGRLLAFVYTDDNRMLNEELLTTGHAYADDRWRHRFYFRFLQLDALSRKNKLGLWRSGTPPDMPLHVRRRLDLDE